MVGPQLQCTATIFFGGITMIWFSYVYRMYQNYPLSTRNWLKSSPKFRENSKNDMAALAFWAFFCFYWRPSESGPKAETNDAAYVIHGHKYFGRNKSKTFTFKRPWIPTFIPQRILDLPTVLNSHQPPAFACWKDVKGPPCGGHRITLGKFGIRLLNK